MSLPQDSPHPLNQVIGLEGFGDKFIGTEFQSLRAQGVSSADDNDGHLRKCPQSPERLKPVHPWKKYIEKHHIRLLRLHQVEGLLSSRCSEHTITCGSEGYVYEPQYPFLVLDKEDYFVIVYSFLTHDYVPAQMILPD